jgi:hypothetical protein
MVEALGTSWSQSCAYRPSLPLGSHWEPSAVAVHAVSAVLGMHRFGLMRRYTGCVRRASRAMVAMGRSRSSIACAVGWTSVPAPFDRLSSVPQPAELSLKVGDGKNRKGGISWGCLTTPLLH